MAREKVGNLSLYMYINIQSISCENILKNIIGCRTFILARTLQEMDIQIINDMFTLTMWKMCNYKMC
jgi:hypothetical protein